MNNWPIRLAAIVVTAVGVAVLTDESRAADSYPAKIWWVPPTTCENAVPLSFCPVAKYELEYVNLTTLKRTIKYPKYGLKGYTLYMPALGDYGFRIRSHGVDGSMSKWSEQIQGRVTGAADGLMIKLPIVPGPAPEPDPDPCNCTCP